MDLDDLRRYVKLAEGYRDGTVSRSEIAAVRMATAYQRVDEQMLELQVAMGASDIMIFALDVDELMSVFPVKRLHYVASDGCALLMREAVDAMDEETFQLYMKYHLSTCEREDLLGVSSHALDIFRKE